MSRRSVTVSRRTCDITQRRFPIFPSEFADKQVKFKYDIFDLDVGEPCQDCFWDKPTYA